MNIQEKRWKLQQKMAKKLYNKFRKGQDKGYPLWKAAGSHDAHRFLAEAKVIMMAN